jgi:hydrogenase nickel incorporation protein HypA/HybF
VHELHAVRDLVDRVEREAQARGARRVTSVRLRYNPLTSLDDDHVQFSFDIAKQEASLLREAALVLTAVPGRVRCGDCRRESETRALPDLCPHCGSVQLQPVEATALVLESFEIE